LSLRGGRPSPWKASIALPRPAAPDVAAAAVLGAIVAYLFADALRGRVFFERDIHLIWHPQVIAFVRSIAGGSWPVWDPYSAFGEPIWSYPTQVLYPFTWLHLVLPPGAVYTASVVAHLVFAGVGLYALGRRLGVSRAGALAGAAAWIATGPVLSVVSTLNLLIGASWLPWIFLAADVALSTGRPLAAFLWGATLAAPLLAGSEVVLMGGVGTAAYALARVDWRHRRDPRNRKVARASALALLFALGLSAGQWLPTLELTRRTARQDLSREIRTQWSLHPADLVQILLPVFPRDLPLRTGGRVEMDEMQMPFLGSVYLGIPLLALSAAALATPRRSRARFFVLLGLGAALFALGRYSFLYDTAVSLIPPLRAIRFPVKAMLLSAFCACVTAGMGFDEWREPRLDRRRWMAAVGLPAIGFSLLALALVLVVALRPGTWSAFLLPPAAGSSLAEMLAPTLRRLLAALGAAIVVAALALWRASGSRRSLAAPGALAVLAVAGLVAAHRGLNWTGPPELYRYRPPTVDAMQSAAWPRVYFRERRQLSPDASWTEKRPPEGISVPVAVAFTLRLYLTPPVGAVWRISNSYGADVKRIQPPPLRQMSALLGAAEGTPLHLKLLRLGAVTHVVALDTPGLYGLRPLSALTSLFGDPVYVFEVPDPLPRAYAVGRARIADGQAALEQLVDATFDPAREVILAGPAGGAPGAASSFSGSARLVELRPDRVRIEADLDQPGYVVLVDAYDPNWTATIDGQAGEVRRANLAFRAVAVPAGRHLIDYRYRPRSVVMGLAITVAAALAGAGLALARLGEPREPLTAGAAG
jgi:hypothetical protein